MWKSVLCGSGDGDCSTIPWIEDRYLVLRYNPVRDVLRIPPFRRPQYFLAVPQNRLRPLPTALILQPNPRLCPLAHPQHEPRKALDDQTNPLAPILPPFENPHSRRHNLRRVVHPRRALHH